MGKSINFRNFYLGCDPCFGWHDHQIWILKKILILTANCMFYFNTHGRLNIHI